MPYPMAACRNRNFGGENWAAVAQPDAAFNFLPFTIQQLGDQFRVDPAWNLQTHAGITVAKTYYVDKSTGNNGNTGLSWEQALATIDTAFGKADVDRIYVRNSWFTYYDFIPLPTRPVEIIAVDDNVYISADLNNAAGAFSAVDSHYVATFGLSSYVTSVMDFSNPNVDGWWGTALTAKTSEAEVDATPNSYYYNYGSPNSTMYIRTFDDRAPDSDLHYVGAGALSMTVDNLTLYIKGVHIWSALLRNSSAAGGLKVYLEDCTIEPGAATVAGVDEIILKNCVIDAGGSDALNIDWRNGLITRMIEIDCDIQNRATAGDAQASTGHNGCYVVRINGKYHDVSGQCCAEAGAGTRTWMLGCELYTSRVGEVGYYTEGQAWLDGVTISDVATDLAGNGTVNIRNLTSGGVYQVGLTVQAY